MLNLTEIRNIYIYMLTIASIGSYARGGGLFLPFVIWTLKCKHHGNIMEIPTGFGSADSVIVEIHCFPLFSVGPSCCVLVAGADIWDVASSNGILTPSTSTNSNGNPKPQYFRNWISKLMKSAHEQGLNWTCGFFIQHGLANSGTNDSVHYVLWTFSFVCLGFPT